MRKRLHVNLFEMNCVGHIVHGMWRHPASERHRVGTIGFWTELARISEAGCLDAVFLADVIGTYDRFGDGPEAALREGVQIPNGDPLMVIPAMAAVTRHLGFGATVSTSYEPPFGFARRASTLDQLTEGRFGWNIVTSYLPNAARNFGHDDEIAHDDRYDRADEFCEVAYKLWEGSWQDGALLSREGGTLARGVGDPLSDPARVHRIDHRGPHFAVEGPHLCAPSPQRTPLLFQAAASGRGMAFAGRHAEILFVGGRTEADVRANIARARDAASACGRDPAGMRFVVMAGIVTGRTDAEAERKLEGYRRFYSAEGALVHAQASIDLRSHDSGATIGAVLAERGLDLGNMSRRFTPKQTVGEALAQIAQFDEGRYFVCGDPARVADAVETWLDVDGIDGINLRQYLSFETLTDFVELVVPELRRRGRYRESYEEGETLRERFFGAGRALLPADHPGARWRDLAAFGAPGASGAPGAPGAR